MSEVQIGGPPGLPAGIWILTPENGRFCTHPLPSARPWPHRRLEEQSLISLCETERAAEPTRTSIIGSCLRPRAPPQC